MRIALFATLFFFLIQASGQILHRADNLNIQYYNEYLKKKKLKLHIWIQFGKYSDLEELNQYQRDEVDSLNILSLVKSDEHFEFASFKDFGDPVMKNTDTCSIYAFLQSNKDSIPQLKDYYKQRRNAANLSLNKRQTSGYFEVIYIKMGKVVCSFRLDNIVYDKYGINVKNELWYPKVRFLIDSIKEIANP